MSRIGIFTIRRLGRVPLLAALLAVAALSVPSAAGAAEFGLSSFDATFTGPPPAGGTFVTAEEHGETVTQAGSHPFAMNISVHFDSTPNGSGGETLNAAPKDLLVSQIAGLVGNPTAVPRCSSAEFLTLEQYESEAQPSCPSSSAVGTASAVLSSTVEAKPIYGAVYNLVPPPGKVMKLGFWITTVPVTIEVSLAESAPFQVVGGPTNISQVLSVVGATLHLWGVPALAVHDPLRGHCLDTGKGGSRGICPASVSPKPFLTLPRACVGPLRSEYAADSWEDPAAKLSDGLANLADPRWLQGFSETHDAAGNAVGMSGCDHLGFSPEISAQPTSRAGSSSSGLDFALEVNGNEGLVGPEGDSNADIEKTVVTLPEGMTANPSVANGLVGCSEAELGEMTAFTAAGVGCPEASKLGLVEVETPLLEGKLLKGSLFLATPYQNPEHTLLAFYVVIQDPGMGIFIVQPLRVEPNPVTGRLTTVAEGMPQLPFSHFRLQFREGARSPLVTPPTCGTYTTQATLYPSDGRAPVQSSDSFELIAGPNGGACPAGGVPPFSPGLEAGMVNNAGGSFSTMYLRIERKDGEQEITGFSTKLPPGLTGSLTGIPFCSEAEIQHAREQSGAEAETAPACPAASQIGRSIAEAGIGSVLAQTPGRLYLAGPFEGAPFSVVDITAAKVGPFDLGTVVVHLPLHIDPTTAQVSIPSGPADQIPHIIDGIVIHLRDIRVYIDRPGFMRNPTSCAPMSLSATIDGSGANFASAADDTAATVTDRFQAADCAALPFEPKFTALTHAKHTRKAGAYLHVVMESGIKQAGIKEVHVALPKALPSELKTLQKACRETQFATNPAGCPAESIVGHAEVQTPILPVPLQGPAYFVSHGGAKFPELILVLQGYDVTIQLDGETFISKNGITSSTFKSVPDQPFSRFSLVLPAGPHSALAGNGNFCHQKLTMPTRIVAQSGKLLEKDTKVMVGGCRPEMWIVKHRVHGAKATIFVHVPAKGKLIANGKGIKRKVKKVTKKGGRVGITVHLTRQMRRKLRHGHHKHVKVKVHLKFKPKHGKPFAKKVKLRLR